MADVLSPPPSWGRACAAITTATQATAHFSPRASVSQIPGRTLSLRAPALDVAQRALSERRVFGILEIPPDTEHDVLRGDTARIPAYVDSAYFLVFNRWPSVRRKDVRRAMRDKRQRNYSLGSRVSAFLGYRAFHKQSYEHEQKRQHSKHPKAVEISKGGCLLLAQIFEFLQT
jgi:hypothetical protein